MPHVGGDSGEWKIGDGDGGGGGGAGGRTSVHADGGQEPMNVPVRASRTRRAPLRLARTYSLRSSVLRCNPITPEPCAISPPSLFSRTAR